MSLQKLLSDCMAAYHSGDFARAEALAKKIVKRQPGHPGVNQILALSLYSQGRYLVAAPWFDKAVALSQGHTSALLSRSANALALEAWPQVESDAKAVLSQNPKHFGAWMNLGIAYREQELWQAAYEAFVKAVDLNPDDVKSQLELAISERQLGLAENSRSLPLPREDAELSFWPRWLVLVRLEAERSTEAAESLAGLLAAHGEVTDALLLQLAKCVRPLGALKLAVTLAEKILPDSVEEYKEALLLLASVHQGRGQPEQAGEYYRQILSVAPEYWQAHSNYLITIQHDPAISAEHIAREHAKWVDSHLASIKSAQLKPRPAAGTLNIAWVSPRLASGPTETFFAQVLERFPRDGVKHYLYKTHEYSDSSTERFIKAADEYVDASKLSATQLQKRARKDRIDIAIELSGHGPHHNLHAFAHRIAPLQLSWLDYFHPTGLPQIDYFVSDKVLGGEELTQCVELPKGRLCFSPPADAPALQPKRSERARFGCFNRVSKLNDTVLRAWAEIIRRCEGASLDLISWQFDFQEQRIDFLRRAENAGIDVDAITLSGTKSYPDLLSAYNAIDVVLDPFPFSGCATSCDALWMGTPVITLSGDTMVSRQTHSVLEHAGLSQWVTHCVEDYIELALETASQVKSDDELKTRVHQAFADNVCQPEIFAKDLELRLKMLQSGE